MFLCRLAAAEAMPTNSGAIAGTSVGVIADLLAPARGATLTAGMLLSEVQQFLSDEAGLSDLRHYQAKEIIPEESNIELTTLRSGFAIEQRLKQLETMYVAKLI